LISERSKRLIGEPPDEIGAIEFFTKLFARALSGFWRRHFYRDEWNIGLFPGPVDALLSSGAGDTRWLPVGPRRQYVADPFALPSGEGNHVLAEEYRYAANRGHIVMLDAAGVGAQRCPAGLDTGVHMSYPFLFQHQGRIHCVPETWQDGCVQLFRAVEFPSRWEKLGVLIDDFPAVDSTLFEHAGRWWLLCGRAGVFSDTMLYVWHAASPFGPWAPHPLNPVKFDVRSSRPAGRPFLLDGSLVRPAQDCSRSYGGAVTINRIIRLSPTEFEEETIGRVAPDRNGPYPHGLHTLCPIGCATLIDGKRIVFDPTIALVKHSASITRHFTKAPAKRSQAAARHEL